MSNYNSRHRVALVGRDLKEHSVPTRAGDRIATH